MYAEIYRDHLFRRLIYVQIEGYYTLISTEIIYFERKFTFRPKVNLRWDLQRSFISQVNLRSDRRLIYAEIYRYHLFRRLIYVQIEG